jgi:hypothetical protein
MKFSIFVLLILLCSQINSQQNFLSILPSQKSSSVFSIITGTTKNWILYGDKIGLTVYVDLSQYKLTKAPYVFTSLNGIGMHYVTTGATSIYELSANGFRVYIRWSDGRAITVNDAITYKW